MSTEPVRVVEPMRLTQGETVEWKSSFDEYPANEWTLEYRYRGAGTGFNVTATADGEDFDAVISSAQSAAMSTGKYEWQAWATNVATPSIIRKIAEGTVVVELGFTTGSTGTVELRSKAKQILDAIDTALLTDSTSNVISYEITTPAGTRKVQKSRNEAIALRREYAAIVSRENARERARNTGKFGKPVVTRMYES
jgi:hypothetical protein